MSKSSSSPSLFSFRTVALIAGAGFVMHNLNLRTERNLGVDLLQSQLKEIKDLNTQLELTLKSAASILEIPDSDKGKLFHEHFEEAFNVVHADNYVMDDHTKQVVELWKPTEDDYYKSDPDYYHKTSELYAGYKHSNLYDRTIYVKWSGPKVGYGVFANLDLPAQFYLGDYTGNIVNDSYNTDYMWTYPIKFNISENKKVRYGIDARHTGNILRFVNHLTKDKLNCEVVYFIRDGVWSVGYRTKKAIKKDEQLFVSYGSSYWTTRKMHDPTIDKPVNTEQNEETSETEETETETEEEESE